MYSLNELLKSYIVVYRCIFLQAPLTNSDTAVLSGSLSTHNGNGGGNINMTVRRVTSAKGWGEVNMHNKPIFFVHKGKWENTHACLNINFPLWFCLC